MRSKWFRLFYCLFVISSPGLAYESSPPLHLLGDVASLAEGFIEGHAPWVVVLGSSVLGASTLEYQEAYQLGSKLAKNYRIVLTGAGHGIMEAANSGAIDAGGVSSGIYLGGEVVNSFISQEHSLLLPSWFDRKSLMVYGASACVFFPGGFGVLDEVVTTFYLLHHFEKNCPLVFVGKQFWSPFLLWLQEVFVDKYNFIEDLSCVYVVDSAQEASDVIERFAPPVALKVLLLESA